MDFAGLEAWGAIVVKGPLLGGARSQIWRAERGAEQLVVRRSCESEPSLRWLVAMQKAAERSGLHPPVIIPARDGRLAVGGWTVEPFLGGQPGQDGDVRLLRPILQRWQARTRACKPRPGRPPLREAKHLPKPVQRMILAAVPDGPLVAVHGDVHAGNLLRLAPGRLALIDWEEARADHGSVDLLHTRLIFGAGSRLLWLGAEAAACWDTEPERGRRLARQLRDVSSRLDLTRPEGWP